MKWFNSQSRLVQIILLLIPGVNWIVEIIVRWSAFLHKGTALRLIIALVVADFVQSLKTDKRDVTCEHS